MRVAFGLPLLQLEAGLYRLPGFHYLAWTLSPVQSLESPRGRSIQLLGYQLSRGPTRRLPRFISLSYESLGRSNGRDLSGWPVQLRIYAVVHSESAAGSPVQPRAYAVVARNAAGPL